MLFVLNILDEIRIVAGQMSPYLLFGFVAAGLLHVLVSPAWMRRHLGGAGIMPVIKSVFMGIPLPLCSCGVIAVTATLRKQGAGRGAATGFLLATPQTGIDSILATWGMLGPVLGVFRPLIALITGIAGGALVSWFDKDDANATTTAASTCADGCHTEETRPNRSIREALRYGLVVLPGDIARPLVVGLVIAGAIAALAPRDMFAPYIGGGIFAMLVMTLVGIPLYVCATASIPLALSFMHLGASPGAALAFLIAGPATNAATIATVWKVLGRRSALIYLATVFVGAIVAGLVFDGLTRLGLPGTLERGLHVHEHAEAAGGWNGLFALMLAVVVLNSMYGPGLFSRLGARKKSIATTQGKGERLVLRVSGMTCSHCARAVEQALSDVEGVHGATVDLTSGAAVVNGDGVETALLIEAVRELGYEAAAEKA